MEYKPAFGHIFADYLGGYSHWGYSDLDVVFGDLPRWIDEDEWRDYDVVTYGFGDQDKVSARRRGAVGSVADAEPGNPEPEAYADMEPDAAAADVEPEVAAAAADAVAEAIPAVAANVEVEAAAAAAADVEAEAVPLALPPVP